MPCSAQTRRGLQWIVGAQLIYKILSAIKVPLVDELVAVPCRLVLAVKQVLRIGRGRQKCHLAALLSFMLKLLLSCPEPTFGEILSPFEPGGEKRKEGVWRGQMLALKSMSNAFLFGTPVPPNGRQYIYSQRGLLCNCNCLHFMIKFRWNPLNSQLHWQPPEMTRSQMKQWEIYFCHGIYTAAELMSAFKAQGSLRQSAEAASVVK